MMRPALRVLFALLLLSTALPACESADETAAARRAQIEVATAMEPLPAAATGPRLSVEELADLYALAMAWPDTLEAFSKSLHDKKGGCEARLERQSQLLQEAEKQIGEASARYVSLAPRYSQAERSRAFKLASPRLDPTLDRIEGAEFKTRMETGMDAFRTDCPQQTPKLEAVMQEHGRVARANVDAMEATLTD